MDKLPTEVLVEIVDLLRDDYSDLWSISYTNKKLHAIANNILYSRCVLDRQDVALFIRALASNPNLQRCVRHILWNSPIHCSGAFEFPHRITEAEFQQISEKVGNWRVVRLHTGCGSYGLKGLSLFLYMQVGY